MVVMYFLYATQAPNTNATNDTVVNTEYTW